MIHDKRLLALNTKDTARGHYLLYWMQASQRTECNHALEYAIRTANEMSIPLIVFFGISKSYLEANRRHYIFMLQGIKELKRVLTERNIEMVVRIMSPEIGAVELSKDATLVVVDRGYTRLQRQWREYAALHVDCQLIQVETDVVVPVEVASSKEAYAAADFRRHISKHLADYMVDLQSTPVKVKSNGIGFEALDIEDPAKIVSDLQLDNSVDAVDSYTGGTSKAIRMLDDFIAHKLDKYADLRNDPSKDYLSGMSPYLHFGQISPLHIALKVREAGGHGADVYLEELIIRRELAMNFVYYNHAYDTYACLPEWARNTLEEHKTDKGKQIYTPEELETGRTGDPYWNASQLEMICTGKMHGYMRMYWGKRLIEWHKSPEEAYRTAIYLNNRYELDGRDPNGYAGIAWCFGKHDRAWQQRPIFGKVRMMNTNGLMRKFDVDAYLHKVSQLCSSRLSVKNETNKPS